MRFFLIVLIFWAAGAGAAPAAGVTQGSSGKVTKETLLSKDRLLLFTITKPCWMDKWKYFCCPVKKIVRRPVSSGKWTDYCYNSRDELIGIYRRDASGSVKRSDFSALPGCTVCGSSAMTQKSWRHDTRPGTILPPRKKKKR